MAWQDTNESPGAEATKTMGGAPAPSGPVDEWLKLSKDAYQRSTTYFDNNYRKQMEDGLRLFNSQHARDSKYNSDAYKYRSKIFRPKSRSVVRKHEATAAMAFFSNPDVTSIDPVDEENDDQIASAGIMKELLQYRLTKSIPWFLVVLGAFQDSMTVGICASFNYWDYATKKKKKKVQGTFNGVDIELEIEKEVPVVDKPCCELLRIENLRFDPGARWDDVVGSSPYLILERPMYLRDVLDRMESGYGKGEEQWKKLSKETLLKARITETSPVQQSRDGKREDPQVQSSTVNEFDIVMIHLNFIKTDGECYVYYTLKDLELLSDPVLLDDSFLHGEIPVTIGFCVIETHKALPNGLVGLGTQLQAETNEIANQRLDNVKFVLNKRWIVRRGSNIDTESILRNVPGGITMANDVEKDLRELTWQDVTSSAYQEQDRLNADYDDLTGGGLNSGSVSTNRRMNETVGGMRLMSQGSNQLTEYTIRVFVETWAEPTLRQIIKLEQYYESDEVVLAIAATKAKQFQRYQMSPDLDKLLKQELTLNVNIGMGATDPEQRFQRFMQAMGAYTQMTMQGTPDMNLPEVRKELFGLAGFKDSKRFFMPKADVRWQQAQQMVQQAESMAEKVVQGAKDRILRGQMQLERKSVDLDLREISAESDAKQLEQDLNLEMQKMMGEFALKRKDQQLEHSIDMQEAEQNRQIDWMTARQDMALAEFKARAEVRIKEFMAKAAAKTQALKASKSNGSGGEAHA